MSASASATTSEDVVPDEERPLTTTSGRHDQVAGDDALIENTSCGETNNSLACNKFIEYCFTCWFFSDTTNCIVTSAKGKVCFYLCLLVCLSLGLSAH